jgi:hypothetical protein
VKIPWCSLEVFVSPSLGSAGNKVAKYIRVLQETKTLGFKVKPRISRIRIKILRQNLQNFQDADIDMPEDVAALEDGLRELIEDGLLRGSDGELLWACVTPKGATVLIVDEEAQ